jgi:hypothetical protein
MKWKKICNGKDIYENANQIISIKTVYKHTENFRLIIVLRPHPKSNISISFLEPNENHMVLKFITFYWYKMQVLQK